MIERINQWDQQWLIWLNDLGSPWLDGPMIFLSNKWVWVPLYTFFIFLIFRHYGRWGWFPLLGAILAVTLADQTTSSLMKPFFERLRPCKDDGISGLIHIVDRCGGKYGFASSHAANSFAIAGFMISMIPAKSLRALWVWAFLVSYSRVYLGVHYPGDVLVGAGVGLGFAWLTAQITRQSMSALKVSIN